MCPQNWCRVYSVDSHGEVFSGTEVYSWKAVVFLYTLDWEIGRSTDTANFNHEISFSRTNTEEYVHTGKHTRIDVKHEQQSNTQRQGLIVSVEV